MGSLKSKIAGISAAALMFVTASAASAATLLDGVTLKNLYIGDTKYDVTFTGDAFDGSLTFNSRPAAREALAAILANSEFQAFFPYPNFAGVLVPHAFDDLGFYVELGGGRTPADGYGVPNGYDWSGEGYTLARFALASAVPEPATWVMMIVGFGAVGSMVRGARRRNVLAMV